MTRILVLTFTLLTTQLFCQVDSVKLIAQFVNDIDSLKNTNQLVKKNYDDMSFCGGSLSGYYQKEELVFIESCYSAESGFGTIDAYLRNNKLVFIKRNEHVAEWEKYYENYPNGEGKYGDSYENMTFTDTNYQVRLFQDTIIKKFSLEKELDVKKDVKKIQIWTICINSMILELQGKPEKGITLYQTEILKL